METQQITIHKVNEEKIVQAMAKDGWVKKSVLNETPDGKLDIIFEKASNRRTQLNG